VAGRPITDTPTGIPYRIGFMTIASFEICGLDELDRHATTGITHVVSILDPEWPEPPEFAAFGPHHLLRLRFHDVIEVDETIFEPPQPHHVEAVLEFGRSLPDGARLLVHCHAGISRSTAATLLLLAQAQPDAEADSLVATIAERRSKAWPNLRMVELGDAALGRNGTLIEAAKRRYRQVTATRPDIVQMMRDCGRTRELEG
jgi:predicted protein tyrosine phosphatase